MRTQRPAVPQISKAPTTTTTTYTSSPRPGTRPAPTKTSSARPAPATSSPRPLPATTVTARAATPTKPLSGSARTVDRRSVQFNGFQTNQIRSARTSEPPKPKDEAISLEVETPEMNGVAKSHQQDVKVEAGMEMRVQKLERMVAAMSGMIRLLQKQSVRSTENIAAMIAAQFDNDKVLSHIHLGCDVHARHQGCPAIVFAVKYNRPELVNCLISHGADPNATDELGQNCVFISSKNGFVHMTRLLLLQGCNPEQPSRHRQLNLADCNFVTLEATRTIYAPIPRPNDIGGTVTEIELSECRTVLGKWPQLKKQLEFNGIQGLERVMHVASEETKAEASHLINLLSPPKLPSTMSDDEQLIWMGSTASQIDVFISYNSAQKEIARKLRKFVSSLNYKVWMDDGEIGSDESVVACLDQATRHSKVMLVMVSTQYNHSLNCFHQLSLRFNQRKLLVPVLVDDVSWPPEGLTSSILSKQTVSVSNHVDMRNGNDPESVREILIDRIGAAIKVVAMFG